MFVRRGRVTDRAATAVAHDALAKASRPPVKATANAPLKASPAADACHLLPEVIKVRKDHLHPQFQVSIPTERWPAKLQSHNSSRKVGRHIRR